MHGSAVHGRGCTGFAGEGIDNPAGEAASSSGHCGDQTQAKEAGQDPSSDVFTMSVDAGVNPEGISRTGSIMVKNSRESRIMITTASTAGARAHFQDKILSSSVHGTLD